MTTGTDSLRLSPGQQEFAERMDCGQVMRGTDQAVCFYRVVAHETIRWIVDVNGSVLDWSIFRSGV
jgi:hypothetical protein